MTRPRPEVAFTAAALALLVLPLLTFVVLAAFGTVVADVAGRDTYTLLLTGSVVLVLLVTAAVLAIIYRISRRERR